MDLTCYLSEEIDDIMFDCPVCKVRGFGLTYGSMGLQEGNYVVWMCIDGCGATGVIDYRHEEFEEFLKGYDPWDGEDREPTSIPMRKILRAEDGVDKAEINNWYIDSGSNLEFCNTVKITLDYGDIATWNPD
jgi:hypothetical protein